MNKTNIEWVKNPDGSQGYTWNPITGCLNGCEYCYARRLANGRLRSRYLANSNVADTSQRLRDPNSALWDRVAIDPFYPRFWPERLWDGFFHPERDSNYANYRYDMIPSRGIFVCDMGELFGDWIPEKWQRQIFEVIKNNSWHRFYLLTKQPQNLIKWSPFPDNCWVGFTATNQEMFYEGCYQLKYVRAKVKFVSLEPLLSFDKLPEVLDWQNWIVSWLKYEADISWVIIGAQTKPYRPPRIEWVREIVDAADKAGILVFLKNNLNPLFKLGSIGYDMDIFWHISNDGRTRSFRQELPNKQPEKSGVVYLESRI